MLILKIDLIDIRHEGVVYPILNYKAVLFALMF